MCHCVLQRAMIYVPFGPVRIIPGDYNQIHILFIVDCEIRFMVEAESTCLIVLSVRAVCPDVSSRTLPARTKHDPAS